MLMPLADVQDAGALSAAVITGGSLAGVGVALFARHPTWPEQPLIDYDLVLVLLPVALLGVSIGTFVLMQTLRARAAIPPAWLHISCLHACACCVFSAAELLTTLTLTRGLCAGMLAKAAFPTWLLTFLLIALMGFLSWKMMQKALQLHASEEACRTEACSGQSPKASQVHSLMDPCSTTTSGAYSSDHPAGVVLLHTCKIVPHACLLRAQVLPVIEWGERILTLDRAPTMDGALQSCSSSSLRLAPRSRSCPAPLPRTPPRPAGVLYLPLRHIYNSGNAGGPKVLEKPAAGSSPAKDDSCRATMRGLTSHRSWTRC